MGINEKYPGKDITELSHFFFDLGNEQLVPAVYDHIMIALPKFQELQTEDEELQDMIIIADFDENAFVFATGTGEDLESIDDDTVFYVAKDERFIECMELLEQICFENNDIGEAHLSKETEVYHWIGDALNGLDEQKELEKMNLSVWGNYEYGESEVDPLLEAFNK